MFVHIRLYYTTEHYKIKPFGAFKLMYAATIIQQICGFIRDDVFQSQRETVGAVLPNEIPLVTMMHESVLSHQRWPDVSPACKLRAFHVLETSPTH